MKSLKKYKVVNNNTKQTVRTFMLEIAAIDYALAMNSLTKGNPFSVEVL